MARHRRFFVIGSVCLNFALVQLTEHVEGSTSDDSNAHCELTSVVQVGLEVETANNRQASVPEATQPSVAITDTGAFNLQQISRLRGHVVEAFSRQLVRFHNLTVVSLLSTNSSSVAGLTDTAALDHLTDRSSTTSFNSTGSMVLVSVLTMMIVCLVSCILYKDSWTMPANNRRTASPHPHYAPGTHSVLPSQQQILAGQESLRQSMLAADKLSFGLTPTAGRLGQSSMPPTALRPSGSGRLSNPNLPTPSPRQLTQMPLSMAGLQQRVQLCDADPVWSRVEPYFIIQTEDLFSVVEGEATGNFDISCEGKPMFAASVLPWGAAPRALLICSAARRGEPLASCAPTLSSYTSATEEICSKLEIRRRDNSLFGTLSPHGADSYAVLSGHRRVLSLFGDQDTGRLLVKIPTNEVVAHAARDPQGQVLEVGMRPEIDPVLMIICMLSVVIFNPEDSFGNI